MDPILIVEDDASINHMIQEKLERSGYECAQAYSGTEALLVARSTEFSAVILDLMLPGLPGEEVLPRLLEIQDVPVLVLSARDDLRSKLDLLTGGAVDYMTKPFSLDELVARLRLLKRKVQGTEAPVLRHHELELDETEHALTLEGVDVNLTQIEFSIMKLLLLHPKRVFSKQEIYNYAWDDEYLGSDKTINVHISNIRKKFKAITEREYIETVWGVGFRLAP